MVSRVNPFPSYVPPQTPEIPSPYDEAPIDPAAAFQDSGLRGPFTLREDIHSNNQALNMGLNTSVRNIRS